MSTSRHTQHADLRGLNARHQPTPWPWIVMAIFWLLAMWAGMQHLDAEAAADAQRLHHARQQQKEADRIHNAALQACTDTHGPQAAYWWEGSTQICAREAAHQE